MKKKFIHRVIEGKMGEWGDRVAVDQEGETGQTIKDMGRGLWDKSGRLKEQSLNKDNTRI